jgi:NADH-quinone oxidoreductase subunit N
MLPTADDLAGLQSALALDLRRFAPELVVSGTILLLLLARLVRAFDRVHLGGIALGGSAAALLALGWMTKLDWDAGTPSAAHTAFTGLLQLDGLALYLRGLLLVVLVLAVVLSRLTGIPDAEDAADYYTLLLGGTLGMMVMTSADHLLMIFLGLEMASLPSYALAGFLKGQRRGSEAALKYVIYGAASSGVTLYGISLLTASFGTGHLPTVAVGFARALAGGEFPPILAAGTVLVLVGFGFKLGAVPFHFWLPDVFEGAAAEVGAFLSVASKAAAVGLTARFLLSLQSASGEGSILPQTVGVGLLVVAALTATLGNLVALAQTNLKRLLAYSTIAHAGYMLMGVAVLNAEGAQAVLFYLAAYLFMNLGAFAAVAVVRNRTGAETVDACRGLIARSPAVGVTLVVFLLSLLGIPPLAGFAGKFQVFQAVFDAGEQYRLGSAPWLGTAFYVLLGIGVVNTVVSAGYYLKVVRAAGLEESPAKDEKGEAAPLGEPVGTGGYLAFLAVMLLVVGVWWTPVVEMAMRAVVRL